MFYSLLFWDEAKVEASHFQIMSANLTFPLMLIPEFREGTNFTASERKNNSHPSLHDDCHNWNEELKIIGSYTRNNWAENWKGNSLMPNNAHNFNNIWKDHSDYFLPFMSHVIASLHSDHFEYQTVIQKFFFSRSIWLIIFDILQPTHIMLIHRRSNSACNPVLVVRSCI